MGIMIVLIFFSVVAVVDLILSVVILVSLGNFKTNAKLIKEIKELEKRLKKNKTEIEAQKEKLDNLRFRIKENGQKIVNGIFGVLEEVFGQTLNPKEKPEETTSTKLEKEAAKDDNSST